MAKFDLRDLVPTILDFEAYLINKDLTPNSVYVLVGAAKKFLLSEPDLESVDAYNEFVFTYAVKKRSNYVYDALKLFIKFKFEKESKVGNNLLRNLLKPRVNDPKKIPRYLDQDNRDFVISLLLNYKHRIMAKIQEVTGVRAGDILRLKRGSISYEEYQGKAIVMRIDFEGKGRKRFVKWIFDESVQSQIDLFIKGNLVDDEYYFLERNKKNEAYYDFNDSLAFVRDYKTNYNNYLFDLKKALKTCGVEYSDWASHDFRRSFARKVWDKTKDPVVLKEMLNHAQFDTTLRYLRGSGLQVKDVYFDLNKEKEENS